MSYKPGIPVDDDRVTIIKDGEIRPDFYIENLSASARESLKADWKAAQDVQQKSWPCSSACQHGHCNYHKPKILQQEPSRWHRARQWVYWKITELLEKP